MLSDEVEDALEEFILQCSAAAFPLTILDVREAAARLYQYLCGIAGCTRSKDPLFGPKWCVHFRRRHPQLALRIAEALEARRVNATNREAVEGHYEALRNVLMANGIGGEARRIWNADETGIALGDGKRPRVFAQKGAKNVNRRVPTQSRHLSIMFAVNAAGMASPPLFLYPAKNCPRSFVEQIPVGDWGVLPTGSGWMTGSAFILWLQQFVNFLNSNVRSDPTERHVLILDGHATHHSVAAAEFAEANNVALFFLPPHTTHFLQPMDVSLFGPFKAAFARQVDIWMREHPAEKCNLLTVPQLMCPAWRKAVTKRNIVSGFVASGICPLNPERGLSYVDSLVESTSPQFSSEVITEAIAALRTGAPQFATRNEALRGIVSPSSLGIWTPHMSTVVEDGVH